MFAKLVNFEVTTMTLIAEQVTLRTAIDVIHQLAKSVLSMVENGRHQRGEAMTLMLPDHLQLRHGDSLHPS